MLSKITRAVTHHLSIKLGILLLLFAVLPLVGISSIFLLQLEKNLTNIIINDHREIIKGHANHVANLLANPADILRSHAELMSILLGSQDRQQLMLSKLAVDFPLFEEIMLIDLLGIVTASSLPGNVSNAEQKNYTNEEAFSVAATGGEYISSMYINDDFVPFIDIAIPCYHLNVISGVLLAQINLRRMWNVVDAICIGNTGRAFVVTDDGKYVAHYDKKKVFKELSIVDAPYYQQLREHTDGYCEFFDQESGQKRVLYYAKIKKRNWILAVEQSAEEVYRFNYLAKLYTVIGVCVLFVLALVTSFVFARYVTRPIRRVENAMQRASKREYDFSIEPGTQDEIGRLIVSFNEMIKKLKRAEEDERLAVFGYTAAHIAHKLKNSVVSLKTYVQLLFRQKDAEGSSAMGKKIESEVLRVEEILSRFSVFHLSEKEHCDHVDLIGFLKNILNTQRQVLLDKNITLTTDIGREKAYMSVDSDKLHEVFINIINNAADAMSNGGSLTVRAKFTVGYVGESYGMRELVFSFTDTGQGFSDTIIQEIWKPFYSSKKYGMGIGLTLCKRIVAEYHGRMDVHNSPEHGGAVVTVSFPVRLTC